MIFRGQFVKKSNAAGARIPFFLADITNHATGVTGATPTMLLSKDGATFASASGTVTEIGQGWYYYNADSADLNADQFIIVHADSNLTTYDAGETVCPITQVDFQNPFNLGLVCLPTEPPTAAGGFLVCDLAGNHASVNVSTLVSRTPTFTDDVLDVNLIAVLGDVPDQTAGRFNVAVASMGANTITAGVVDPDVVGDLFSTTTVAESYAADGAAATPAQLLYMILSAVGQYDVVGTTLTARRLDGTTAAMTFTLDNATAPTSRQRSG